MTPEQKIKHAILLYNQQWTPEPALPEITVENVDEIFEERGDEWQLQDATNEVREGSVETDIPCQSSRHYESKSVASQMPDGTWVGWTYWYGGGKYGEPEAIDWIAEAYGLDVVEEEKIMTIRTFSKSEKAR